MFYIKRMWLKSDFLMYIALAALTGLTAVAGDYYKVLGLEKTASGKDIKKAFRRLALQYHPDKNKDPDAEERFREIAEAYEILSDENKRRQYDANGAGSGSFRAGGNTRARDFHFNFDDLFKQFEDDIFGGEHADHFASHFENHFARHAENVGGDFDFEDIFNAQGFDAFGFGGDSFFGHNDVHVRS